MDRQTFENTPLCPTGHRPFGAAAQKERQRDRLNDKNKRQSTGQHEMHREEDAMKKKTPIYDFFPAGESRLYWYPDITLF